MHLHYACAFSLGPFPWVHFPLGVFWVHFSPGEKCQILENLRIRQKSNILYYVDNVLFDTFPQGKTVLPKKREQPDQLIRHEKRPLPGLWYRFRMNLNWYEVIVKNFTNL